MGRLIIVEPLPVAGVTASHGSGAANLKTPNPREVWADAASGRAASLTIDLGAPQVIDTVFLGYVYPPAPEATWAIATGLNAAAEQQLLAEADLRVPGAVGILTPGSHAFWHGPPRTGRYLAITLTQPAGSPPLTAGVLVVGQAFVAAMGQEWGFGRRPIDTGTATPLPSGGFATVEGVRKRAVTWTFGDLSVAEADRLERLALNVGETRPGLVVEDPDATPGLHGRIHYGLFERWRAFERRNRRQTRWELGIEEWV